MWNIKANFCLSGLDSTMPMASEVVVGCVLL